jgi:hypothetical protein
MKGPFHGREELSVVERWSGARTVAKEGVGACYTRDVLAAKLRLGRPIELGVLYSSRLLPALVQGHLRAFSTIISNDA